ncbi:translation initiation factor IF-2, chloroplastic-like [Rhododendron vialii]|uniref:translation initiation factor IF-2, chloroplastic-like n=1 Tax=Rhododendron vialii TaxID=182163 RepID=UPI00265D8D66|nr:translation initiation factor IF-2, chloroplastic-like [Rhododendron vialii]
MAYLASLVSLGSAAASSPGNLDIHRVYLSRNVSSFCGIWVGRRWKYVGICKYSGKTGLAEQETSFPLDLKTVPKPILKSKSPLDTDSGYTYPWDDRKSKDDEEERSKVLESLGEVLEKAEELVTKPPTKTSPKPIILINGKPVDSTVGLKSKAARSVWRRGNPVTSTKDVVKESPKIEKVENHGTRLEGVGKVDSQPVLQLPVKAQSKLQGRPSLAPPPRLVKKPTILKDIGEATKALTKNDGTDSGGERKERKPLLIDRFASKKPTILKDTEAAMKAPTKNDGTDLGGERKERKPILIDKFASKNPVFDPWIAEAVLAPTKQKAGKGPVPGKFRDDFRKKSSPTDGPRRRRIDNAETDDDEEASELNISIPGIATKRRGRKWSKASRKAARLQAAKEAAPVKVEILEVGEEGMLMEELADNLAINEGEIFGYLFSKSIASVRVKKIDRDIVKMICKEYDVEVIDSAPHRVEEMARKKEILDEDDLDKLEDRPPVLTIMGHVDHGKTTLLDYIRKSKVAASEAGGITQGIGAYKVLVPIDAKLQPCVFLDTPGHEAFGAMRARGARVTDIAIIVVAADDGIRPQTNEAIAHAKAAGVPIVIAINKIDKDGANPEQVMQELASIGLMPEEWGGDVPVVQISALKGEKVDDLLETVMLVAEMEELKANPHRGAKGTVIEAGLHKAKGPIATFIVQNGTLKRGDMVVCGEAYGKVRALFDEKGDRVDEAGPSNPVQVMGLNIVPIAGDEFEVVGSLVVAREKAEARAESLRKERIAAKAGDGKVTLASLASAVSAGKQSGLDLHQLNIVMKADLQGSIEAIRQALLVLPQDNVSLRFLLQATGDVSASDIDLAVVSKAIIVGFNVKTPGSVKSYADIKGIEVRTYRVIYDLIDDVRNAMEGLLDLVEEQIKIGSAEVRAIFSSGSSRVAGCMVTEGKVVEDSGIRVLRKGKTVQVGILNSLRRVKEQVKEVNVGLECGIRIDSFLDWEEGDILEAFNTVKKKRTLEEASATMAAAIEGMGIGR